MASINSRTAATAADRAAEAWLLSAADSADQARMQWQDYRVALLRCGRAFAAVRISGTLVFAAAGTENPTEVEAFLAASLRGPVFVDENPHRYYVLIPADAAIRSEWSGGRADREVAYLDDSTYMGVPHPAVRTPSTKVSMHWCVPLDPDGDLCPPDAVNQMISVARLRLLDLRAEVSR